MSDVSYIKNDQECIKRSPIGYNCDTLTVTVRLTNKMDELLFYINTNNPDILVLTEVAPKNNRYLLQKSELEIKGYSLYINNFEEKGVSGSGSG